jgi:probable rRNA maturation factor
MKQINFFCEDVDFVLKNKAKIRNWIFDVIASYQKKPKTINYIFCSDEHLRKVNIDFLAHDYYTDIITFDNADYEDEISGDLYLSIDRIAENAKDFGVTFQYELGRVLIHGILHLIGYTDETDEGEAQMRILETKALETYPSNV